MKNIDSFKKQFSFKPEMKFLVGIERECFTVTRDGNIVPQAHKVLLNLKDAHKPNDTTFGYELSACQVETRIGPCHIEDLHRCIDDTNKQLENALYKCHLFALHKEVGPETMPLDVYPDPTGRYQEIIKDMPHKTLLAACRVIGTHVHIGMENFDVALRIYNDVIQHCAELCTMGDNSSGERLAIYKQMAPDFEPKPYASWNDYYQTALQMGFAEDPRKCWTLIRISIHGTIEFRMFGVTDSIECIVEWAKYCRNLCISVT